MELTVSTSYPFKCPNSYAPAFQQYRDRLAVVHFVGSFKPWQWLRFADGAVFPRNTSSKDSIDLVQKWWNIYDKHVGGKVKKPPTLSSLARRSHYYFFPALLIVDESDGWEKGKRHFVVFPPSFWLAFFFPSLLFFSSFLYLALPFSYYQWLLFRLLVRALCISGTLGEGGGEESEEWSELLCLGVYRVRLGVNSDERCTGG